MLLEVKNQGQTSEHIRDRDSKKVSVAKCTRSGKFGLRTEFGDKVRKMSLPEKET